MSFQKLNQIPFRTDNGVGTDGPELDFFKCHHYGFYLIQSTLRGQSLILLVTVDFYKGVKCR